MSEPVCPECTGELERKIVRVLTACTGKLFGLTAFNLYVCGQCGATYVPKGQDINIAEDKIIATSHSGYLEVLINDYECRQRKKPTARK